MDNYREIAKELRKKPDLSFDSKWDKKAAEILEKRANGIISKEEMEEMLVAVYRKIFCPVCKVREILVDEEACRVCHPPGKIKPPSETKGRSIEDRGSATIEDNYDE